MPHRQLADERIRHDLARFARAAGALQDAAIARLPRAVLAINDSEAAGFKNKRLSGVQLVHAPDIAHALQRNRDRLQRHRFDLDVFAAVFLLAEGEYFQNCRFVRRPVGNDPPQRVPLPKGTPPGPFENSLHDGLGACAFIHDYEEGRGTPKD